MSKPLTLVGLSVAALAATGCQSLSESAGMSRNVPDEFLVVTQPPLSVPPDFALRPPPQGQVTPQELRPNQASAAAVFGENVGANASPGERRLVANAGATAVDNAVRGAVEYEAADVLRKPRSLADRIMFWRTPTKAAPPAANTGPLDPVAEAERLEIERRAGEVATGGEPVIIREGGRAFKLPGM
jgi:hypothetical protein